MKCPDSYHISPSTDDQCYTCDGTGEVESTYCGSCQAEAMMTRPIDYHQWARKDAYGIFTGLYCDDCYDDEEKYPYRKDDYFDPSYAGERLYDE